MDIGGCILMLILDQCEELDTGMDAAWIGAFWIVESRGSVGIDADEGVFGGSPAGMKFW